MYQLALFYGLASYLLAYLCATFVLVQTDGVVKRIWEIAWLL